MLDLLVHSDKRLQAMRGDTAAAEIALAKAARQTLVPFKSTAREVFYASLSPESVTAAVTDFEKACERLAPADLAAVAQRIKTSRFQGIECHGKAEQTFAAKLFDTIAAVAAQRKVQPQWRAELSVARTERKLSNIKERNLRDAQSSALYQLRCLMADPDRAHAITLTSLPHYVNAILGLRPNKAVLPAFLPFADELSRNGSRVGKMPVTRTSTMLLAMLYIHVHGKAAFDESGRLNAKECKKFVASWGLPRFNEIDACINDRYFRDIKLIEQGEQSMKVEFASGLVEEFSVNSEAFVKVLPNEIFEHIASYLSARDQRALGKTSSFMQGALEGTPTGQENAQKRAVKEAFDQSGTAFARSLAAYVFKTELRPQAWEAVLRLAQRPPEERSYDDLLAAGIAFDARLRNAEEADHGERYVNILKSDHSILLFCQGKPTYNHLLGVHKHFSEAHRPPDVITSDFLKVAMSPKIHFGPDTFQSTRNILESQLRAGFPINNSLVISILRFFGSEKFFQLTGSRIPPVDIVEILASGTPPSAGRQDPRLVIAAWNTISNAVLEKNVPVMNALIRGNFFAVADQIKNDLIAEIQRQFGACPEASKKPLRSGPTDEWIGQSAVRDYV